MARLQVVGASQLAPPRAAPWWPWAGLPFAASHLPELGSSSMRKVLLSRFFFKGEGAVTPEESNVRPQVSRPDGGKTGDLVQPAPCFLGDPRVTAPLGVALADVREAHHTDHWQWAEAPKPHPCFRSHGSSQDGHPFHRRGKAGASVRAALRKQPAGGREAGRSAGGRLVGR